MASGFRLPTRPVQSAAPPSRQGTALAAGLRSVCSELSEEFLERHEPVRMMIVSLLAMSHPFLLGPPGTSKSALVRAVCDRVVGARYAEFLCDRSMPLEVLAGPIDLKAYQESGDWRRKSDGYLPTAHIAFLDEIGKAGPVALTPILGAANERLWRDGDRMISIPLLMMAAASNEMLEPELAALWDRFLVRMAVDYLAADSAFASLIESSVQAAGTRPAPTVVDLADLEHAVRREVPAIPVPAHLVKDLTALRRQLRDAGVIASDRRWKQSVRLLQASAYLDGRERAERSDLPVLVHALWSHEPDIPVVREAVLDYEPADAKELRELESRAAKIAGEIASRRAQPRSERARYGGQARADLEEIRVMARRVDGDAARAATLAGRCDVLLREVLVDVLNLSPAKADQIVAAAR